MRRDAAAQAFVGSRTRVSLQRRGSGRLTGHLSSPQPLWHATGILWYLATTLLSSSRTADAFTPASPLYLEDKRVLQATESRTAR